MLKANLNTTIAVCVLIMALAGSAGAVTYYVDPNGFKDFTTIQAAIDASSNDDEIEVAPGTYNEAIDFLGKAVKLYSREGPDVTIIDGIMAYHVVQCISSEGPNTILEGFTITGGDASGFEPNEQCGGGMYNYNSSPTVTDCSFTWNSADANGGGMYNKGGSPTVTNCTFTSNWAGFMDPGKGGGMYNKGGSPTVTNCTFSQNGALMGMGGGMYNSDSNPTVANCILWGDTPDEIVDYGTSSTTVNYSDVEGGTGESWFGTGCIDADPCFADAIGGDWHLRDFSPCVDAGNNNSVPAGVTTDLDDNPRFVDDANVPDTGIGTPPIVDMGAYERQISSFGLICNVTKGVWYLEIQAAIDAADPNDEIKVLPGTYNEAINFNGKAVRLYSSGGPEVTIIDGTGHYHVVQCASGEDANTILEGFTITGGNANGPDPDDQRGGGMYNYNSSPTINNCTFSGNTAISSMTLGVWVGGGGMCNDYYSSPTVTNCIFNENSISVSVSGGWVCGGGMYNYYYSSPTVTGCTFTENTSTGPSYSHGGGVGNRSDSSPTVTNCTFTNNSSVHWGGGMYNDAGSHSIVTNCTFSGNTSDTGGGGIGNYNSSPTVTNCIFWDDTPDEIYNVVGSNPNVTYSDVEGGTGQSWFGTGCIDANPCFVNSGGGDLRLLPVISPCIDAGDNNSVPADTADLDGDGNTAEPIPFDLDGHPRFVDHPLITNIGNGTPPIVDMGAYEHQAAIIYVDANTPDNNDGSSWAKAYKHLQDALAVAQDGNDIVVAQGTYKPDANTDDPCGTGNREATFQLINGVAIYGGFAGYLEPDPNARDIDLYETILSGDINMPGSSDNSYHVVVGSGTDANAVLDGFTITGGNANGSDANGDGGGMFNWFASPTVTNCTFSGNLASSGGAMYNNNSNPTVTNCTFSGNIADYSGGGMYNITNSSPTVTNCIFSGNTTTYGGGGISNNDYCSPIVTNCTLTGNSSVEYGGGMDNWIYSNPTVTNCILWGNTATPGPQIYNDGTSSAGVNYANVQGGWSGTGNINANPCFVNPDSNDFHLLANSPCIDAGDNDSVPADTPDLDGDGNSVEPTPWDLDGRPRFADGDCNDTTIVDMGAYEFDWAHIGDFDGSCDLDFVDFAYLGLTWQKEEGQPGYDPNCDISLPANGIIDEKDLKIFTDNWLAGK